MTSTRISLMWRMLFIAASGAVAVGATPSPAAFRPLAQADQRVLIAKGDSIFHGQLAGGLCWTCHGMDAKGMKGLGPNLTDKEWLHGDGSLEFIKKTVTSGISMPRKSSTPMLPGGGMPLTTDQITAVATYVASLSVGARK